MLNYQIENKKNNEAYVKAFKSDEDVKAWIVATLDLSLDWSYKRLTQKKIVEVKEND